jgi:argininosuccinate lyase
MTRGKMEKTTAMAIGNLASTLAKFCMDVCTYSGQDFGFFNLDKAYTTGSSIMPHKQNPDGFELVRAKCNQLQALPYELSMVLTNLSTGYHRDFQVLKERFIPAIHSMKDCLYMLIAMTTHLDVNKEIVSQDKYILLFTVEEVNKLVLAGVPFRDAYKEVGAKVNNGAFKAVREVNHSHLGSIGNLGTDQIRKAFKETHSYFEQQ